MTPNVTGRKSVLISRADGSHGATFALGKSPKTKEEVAVSADQARQALEDHDIVTDDMPDHEVHLWLIRFGPAEVWDS